MYLRALVEQGRSLTVVPGPLAWTSAGVATVGATMGTVALLGDVDGVGLPGLVMSVAGSAGAYGFGALQWSVNGLANHRETVAQPPPLALRVSGRW